MEIRSQSKTGPRVPSPPDLTASLRAATRCPVPAVAGPTGPGPRQLRRLEVEIHDHFRRLADQMTASLLATATEAKRPGRAWKKGGPDPADGSRRPPERRTLKLRLLGRPGRLDRHRSTAAPRPAPARDGAAEGAGPYPELAALGIRKGATPALHSQVGRLTALLPSIDLARDELRQQGPTLDEKAVHRMARQLGAEVLATRTRDLQRYREGQLPRGPGDGRASTSSPRSMAAGSASARRSRPRNARA